MPKTSLAASPPPSAIPESLPLRTLSKTVVSRGLCTRARIDEGNDPWFPATRSPERLYDAARRACRGCPVIDACRERALLIERHLPEAAIEGIFGALSPYERIDIIRAQRNWRAA